MRLASFSTRALAALPQRLRAHARSRSVVLAVVIAAGVSTSMWLSTVPEATPTGVAEALGAAAGGVVDPGEFVWAPSRGAFVDAVWGRDVTFLARTVEGGRLAPRDVYRARVTIAPGGHPQRVETVDQESATPLADEHDLVAVEDVVAWAVRGVGGEHGATVSAPDPPMRPGAVPGLRAKRAKYDIVFEKPAESLAIELRGDRLLLEVRDGEDEGRALVDLYGPEASVSGKLPDFHVERRPEEGDLQKDGMAPAKGAPPTVHAPVDATLFPPPFSWQPIGEVAPAVASERATPAAVVRAVVEQGGDRIVVTGFDMRQLALRVVPGPLAPPALAGLPGSARLSQADATRLVATTPVLPVRAALPGAMEVGRVISPLAVDAPRIAADERGTPSFAGGSLVGKRAFAPFGAVQTADPTGDEPVAGWCEASTGAVFVAVASPPRKSVIDRALAPLSCVARAWVSGAVDAEPRLGASSGPNPFAAFLRARSFPEGRKETWTPSPGRQPTPAFRPAVLEREESVLGEHVRVLAFVEGRFSWALRAGTRERTHRAGGTFPSAIEAPLLARAIAAVDVGLGQRKRPNGLTIGGSTGHAYASRGAVLFASPGGLVLLPSAEVREDPRDDAVELSLTASGGAPTPLALQRGLVQQRGDICVLPDGTALVAMATFDSHAATAEALCRLGCSDVAALDRGLDVVPTVVRADADPVPATHTATRLIALDRESPVTP